MVFSYLILHSVMEMSRSAEQEPRPKELPQTRYCYKIRGLITGAVTPLSLTPHCTGTRLDNCKLSARDGASPICSIFEE
jgi:hypothetical protein